MEPGKQRMVSRNESEGCQPRNLSTRNLWLSPWARGWFALKPESLQALYGEPATAGRGHRTCSIRLTLGEPCAGNPKHKIRNPKQRHLSKTVFRLTCGGRLLDWISGGGSFLYRSKPGVLDSSRTRKETKQWQLIVEHS